VRQECAAADRDEERERDQRPGRRPGVVRRFVGHDKPSAAGDGATLPHGP